jgi:hypothetical protein
MCAYKRKTWQEKLNDGRKPHTEIAGKDFAGIHAGQRLLIPTPRLIDGYIRHIPKGKMIDTATLRSDLAQEYGADATCPLTTGIFLHIVAEAAFEEHERGTPVEKTTPFWRVIDEGSSTAKKLTFGTAFLKEQQKKENIT